jgi:hypothetical protein
MAHASDAQLYLRAEPTEEGRDLLLLHRRRIHETLRSLEITPRLVDRSDLHRTEIFLDSPHAWMRAFAAVGADVHLSQADLSFLADIPNEQRDIRAGIPWHYDVFYVGGSSAVFVLRLKRDDRSLMRTLVHAIEQNLQGWEEAGRVPSDTTRRLCRHRLFPLKRDQTGGKPHVTLARGRVSRKRHRDVLRSLHALNLASQRPIPFDRIDLRAVRSARAIARYAPHA